MARFPNNLAGDERLARAKARADKLVDHVATLFVMHEANAIIIYSDQLAGQIPPLYAAHAFNQFQQSMHLFEIIRLAALWDSPRDDRESIPTIISLFDTQELIERLVREVREECASESAPHDLRPSSDPDIIAAKKVWWERARADRAVEEAKYRREWLDKARSMAAEIRTSDRLKALRDFRDANIAHNLDLPEPDIRTMTSVYRLKYGDEAALLKDTVTIADALHHGLNRTAFDWHGSQEIARENAKALWHRCTFDIPRGGA